MHIPLTTTTLLSYLLHKTTAMAKATLHLLCTYTHATEHGWRTSTLIVHDHELQVSHSFSTAIIPYFPNLFLCLVFQMIISHPLFFNQPIPSLSSSLLAVFDLASYFPIEKTEAISISIKTHILCLPICC